MAHGPDLSLSIARLTFGDTLLYKDFQLNIMKPGKIYLFKSYKFTIDVWI